MRKLFIVSALFAVAVAFSVQSAEAAVSPVAVSIGGPVQFPPGDFTITGVRASALWGHHRDVYGIDLGLLGNITDQSFVGLAVAGLFNMTKGNTSILGLQLAGGANLNYNKTKVYGAQLALGANYNSAESSVIGVQAALLGNFASHTTVYGLQLGLINRAKEVYGFQIGLVNFCENLHGIQIGLLNFHRQGLFSVSPIINVGF